MVEEVSFPLLSECIAIYYTIMSAEASTNLARFDGVRFGLQADTQDYETIQEYYTAIRSQ